MSLEIYYNDGTPKYCGMPDMHLISLIMIILLN